MSNERVKPQIGGLASLLQTAKQKKIEQEQASETQSLLDLTPTPSTSTALGSLDAQGNQSTRTTLPAQGTSVASGAQRRRTARGKQTARSRTTAQGEISPQRDFMKSANSVVRDALRNGLFRGKSKQIYDYLYSKTRGAVVPRMSAQLRRTEIMDGSHVGSTHTLRDNLRHLKSVGLVNWEEKAGEQDGNEYFVYLPEEAHLPFDFDGNPVHLNTRNSTPSDDKIERNFEADPRQLNCPGHLDHPGQKLPRPPRAVSALGAQGSSPIDATIYGNPNTSFKTYKKIDDDEAAATLARLLRDTTKEVTGGEPSPDEIERWKEVFEVLAAELKIAAARTTVSSAPAFLAEHLRRRLWKKDKKQIEAEGQASQPEGNVQLDRSKCPDCGGSGFYYPTGFDAGVAKCRHEKLTETP